MPLTLTSLAFEMNGVIPSRFTCEGKNISPDLIFSNIPKNTQSLALIMEDPDVPHSIRQDGVWDHWIVWNMPPETPGIDEGGIAPGISGLNSRGNTSYGGPCPPDKEHRYIFTLYALNTLLPLKAGATKAELLKSASSHIIEQAQLIGRYKKHS